jgi:hypothetical protein
VGGTCRTQERNACEELVESLKERDYLGELEIGNIEVDFIEMECGLRGCRKQKH